ncbi:PI-actitoxin-Axm2b-like [Clavelina lepadiformis]|uniref:PI-actitoxin-Axm2b-like n=1 Tax=Clavelina lepadiformis TaxID=159417 RepID=UPI0040426125
MKTAFLLALALITLIGAFGENSPAGDTCSLPAIRGLCFAWFQRWHYNSATGQCEIFIYGGCQGNENRFFNRKDCEKKCLNV